MLSKINRKDKKIYTKGRNKKAVLILNGFATQLTETDLVFNFFKKKGYTVARPKFHISCKSNDVSILNKSKPAEWLVEAKAWLRELSEEVDDIYVIGSSFGANLGLSLLTSRNKKIRAFVAIEMPVIFNFKFKFLSNIIQPLFKAFNIKRVRKDSIWYRGKKAGEVNEENGYSYVSVEATGLIREYINSRTKTELKNVKTPVLLVQSVKSDVLGADNARYVLSQVKSKIKDVYYVPINNHDFNLLDDDGKVIMLEKIYVFIRNT